METIEADLTLDDIDLLSDVIDGFCSVMDEGDEDRAALLALSARLSDFTDKVTSMSEYLTGNDWPADLPLKLVCRTADLR